MNALDPLIAALRKAGEPADHPTRLATVVSATTTTVTVQFDGEASPSSRAYPKTYAPTVAGDRVVMLRTGSTWTGIARIPGVSPDTDWITPTLLNNWNQYGGGFDARYRRLNGVVYLKGLVAKTLGTTTEVVMNLPAGFRPSTNTLRVTATASSAATHLYIIPGGNVYFDGTASGTWTSIECSFPADA